MVHYGLYSDLCEYHTNALIVSVSIDFQQGGHNAFKLFVQISLKY